MLGPGGAGTGSWAAGKRALGWSGLAAGPSETLRPKVPVLGSGG